MDTFAQFLAGFQEYMETTSQEAIDARWNNILADYTSDDLTIGDIDSRAFSMQDHVSSYFVRHYGHVAQDVQYDGGIMQQAA